MLINEIIKKDEEESRKGFRHFETFFCSRCFTVRHCSSCFLDIQDRGVKNAFRYLTSVHTKYFKITVQYLSRFARFVKFMNSCEFYAFCNEWIFMNLTNSWFLNLRILWISVNFTDFSIVTDFSKFPWDLFW